jgi:hypothetical protein
MKYAILAFALSVSPSFAHVLHHGSVHMAAQNGGNIYNRSLHIDNFYGDLHVRQGSNLDNLCWYPPIFFAACPSSYGLE